MEPTENQFKPLYHGTIENLKPGDIVKPRTTYGTAWAGRDMNAVIEHTQDRIHSGLGFSDKNQTVNYGNLYEVEEIPGAHYNYSPIGSATPGAVGSEDGFKVKGQIASVLRRRAREE